MNMILIKPEEVDAEGRVRLADHRAAHIVQVLRLSAGGAVRIGMLNGPRGLGVIERAEPAGVGLRCVLEPVAPPPPRVDLLLALPRPKVMKRLWAPLASLGLGRILITNAAQVERNYFDTHWLAREFYEPLLLEGLQQSGETWLPEVAVRREFRPFIEDELDPLCPASVRIVGDPTAEGAIRNVRVGESARILLAVGPEGGWTPFEMELLAGHGFIPAHAGGGTLRTDVACLVLLALVRDRVQQTAGPHSPSGR
jgi:16S rRNA (uracil1498-N3)-methyltransferase